MAIITVGIDLAKNVFAVHGIDDNGKAVLVKPVTPKGQPKGPRVLPLMLSAPSRLRSLIKGEEYTDQGQDCYEERTRKRALWQLAQRAKKKHETHRLRKPGLNSLLKIT